MIRPKLGSLVACILMLPALHACGGSSDTIPVVVTPSTSVLPPGLTDPDLVGEWVSSECSPRESGGFMRLGVTFGSDGSQTDYVLVFRDSSCSDSTFRTSRNGTYTASAGLLDISATDKTLTSVDEVVTQNFNSFGNCGIDTWDTGVSFDVTGCALFTSIDLPADFYTRYLVDGDKLHLSDNIGLDPQFRTDAPAMATHTRK